MSKIRLDQSISYLLTGEKKKGFNKQNNLKAFIDYSQIIDDMYGILEDNNSTKKRKVLIVSDNMTDDVEANKKIKPILAELFMRGKKSSVLVVFISQPYFAVLKT